MVEFLGEQKAVPLHAPALRAHEAGVEGVREQAHERVRGCGRTLRKGQVRRVARRERRDKGDQAELQRVVPRDENEDDSLRLGSHAALRGEICDSALRAAGFHPLLQVLLRDGQLVIEHSQLGGVRLETALSEVLGERGEKLSLPVPYRLTERAEGAETEFRGARHARPEILAHARELRALLLSCLFLSCHPLCLAFFLLLFPNSDGIICFSLL